MNADELAGRAGRWAKLPEPYDATLTECAAAVCALVNALPVGSAPWSAEVILGATMLTARLHRRRNSPAGIESMSEMGATYVSRYDSDIARLLKIEAYALPVVI
ncbi:MULTISPECIES: hypothetical protein [Schaalia]|uniref:hypothetical protein n=1 Tax=Schaalia TaxID=2529408 RepID=UPI0026ECEE43|nr:hypothetical protein [Schaalia hyovaginalis]MDD7554545.1 hypothetical protein [Schaalia hyovaginalis]MDY3093380.1 hypothetical protein [Schaalia hyovaginalis]